LSEDNPIDAATTSDSDIENQPSFLNQNSRFEGELFRIVQRQASAMGSPGKYELPFKVGERMLL